jgi:DNA-binding IclR family transcriptional regulator
MSATAGVNRYQIRSVDRALAILQLFSVESPRWSVVALSAKVQLPVSTTYRLLSTLEARNFIRYSQTTGKYEVGLACLQVAKAVRPSVDIRQEANPYLEGLRESSKETVHLAVLVDMQVVYLEKLPGLHRIVLMGSRVGSVSPSHCTGLGKAMLAFLPPDEVDRHFRATGLRRFTPNTIVDVGILQAELEKVRRMGYALDQEEHEPQVVCVAAPILNHSGVVLAAISVSGPAQRMYSAISAGDMCERVTNAARDIAAQVGNADSV